MHRKSLHAFMSFIFLLISISLACATSQPIPAPPNTVEPTATATISPTATRTLRPSPTPRPTQTPNLAATGRAEELNAEVQEFFEKGYLTTTDGRFIEFDDFRGEWAQLTSYRSWNLNVEARSFYLSAHFKWTSAYRNADTSGCGFTFARQDNEDHYAVFLDRSKILFVETRRPFYTPIGLTRGSGRVEFDNPADSPSDADFTLIVKDAYAYVLVNGEVVGEYTLAQSKILEGKVGLALLSGTNRDYGTRCEMSNLHLWLPEE